MIFESPLFATVVGSCAAAADIERSLAESIRKDREQSLLAQCRLASTSAERIAAEACAQLCWRAWYGMLRTDMAFFPALPTSEQQASGVAFRLIIFSGRETIEEEGARSADLRTAIETLKGRGVRAETEKYIAADTVTYELVVHQPAQNDRSG